MASLLGILLRLRESVGFAPLEMPSPAGSGLAPAPVLGLHLLDQDGPAHPPADPADLWGPEGPVRGVTAPGSPYH